MSTVIEDVDQHPVEETPVTRQYQTEDGQPNLALLEDRTPEGLKASSAVTLIIGALGTLFVLLNYSPLWHTDFWGHLLYGEWIWSHGALPKTEPFMPLSVGMSLTDTAWLSQLIGYLTIEQFGVPGIQFLYASSIVFVAGCLAFSLYARTQHAAISLLAVFLFYWADYQQLAIVRPQLTGMMCFAAVLAMATSFRWRKWYYVAIPAIFAIWANLHGSFIVGIVTLGALTVGRAIDVFRRTRSVKMVLAESRTRQLFILTELAAAAALLNPYGIGIYPAVFSISGHPNMAGVIEWEPLTLRMKQGQAAAVLALSLIALYRLSPRRVTTGEVLLLVGFGVGAMWTSRIIVWWAPVAAYYFGLHAAAVWRVWMKSRPAAPKRGGLYSVSILGLLWIFFAYTPFGGTVLHGGPKTPEEAQKRFEKSVSRSTPLEAAKYLKQHPPQGQIYNTFDWGDYLLWAGPENLQVFAASHVHLIPEEVWEHYNAVSHGSSSWQAIMDRYSVNTIVLRPSRHPALVDRIKQETEKWKTAYESNTTIIFERKNPI